MGLESLVLAFVTIAFAIPTLFEKVWKKGYEERVEQYEEDLRSNLLSSLNDLTKKVNETKKLTKSVPDVDKFVNEWYNTRDKANRLHHIINVGQYNFVVWFALFVVASAATGWLGLDYVIGGTTLKDISWILFFIGSGLAFYYIYRLIAFDRELRKYEEQRGQIFTLGVSRLGRSHKLGKAKTN